MSDLHDARRLVEGRRRHKRSKRFLRSARSSTMTAMARMRSLLPNVGLAAASALVVLIGFEIALRVMAPPSRGSPPEQGRGKASRFDSELGWANLEGAETRLETAEFSASVTINSLGLRGRETAYERIPGSGRIALLGDSFAWGFGVSDDEVMAVRLEEELGGGVEVLNMGTVGFGTDQELLFYRREGRRYAPDVVALVFCSNDVMNNMSERDRWYGKPRFVLEGDTLRLTNVPVAQEASWDDWLTEYEPRRPARSGFSFRGTFRSYAFLIERYHNLKQRLQITRPGLFADRYNPYIETGWRVTFALIEALRREVEADGATFVVLSVPRREQMRYESWIRPNVTLAAFCAGAGIAYFDFLEPFRGAPEAESMFYPIDGHWNAAGHAFAAAELAAWLQRESLIPRAGAEPAGAGAP